LTRFIAWFGTARGSLVLLWLLWLAPRLLLAFTTVIPSSDAAWYFDRAREMSEGMGYRDHGGPTAYWPPGWPLTMTVLFRMFGVSTLVVALFNLLCNFVSAWVMQDLARRIGHSVLAGRVALLLIALYPNNAFYVPLAMTECFYTALLLGAAGCWCAAPAGRGWCWPGWSLAWRCWSRPRRWWSCR
jgi:hypothetical protein